MASKSSSSASSTTSNLADQRIVAGEGALVAGAGGTLSSSSQVTINNAGAERMAEFNSQLLGLVAETNTDAVKSLAQFGTDALQQVGESVTDLYARSGANTARAWELTLDASRELIKSNTDAARATAAAITSSAEPIDSKMGDAIKWVALALAGLVGGSLLFKKG